ncbi:DinB family protein [Flavobacterium wongokense]|uniref:DinB family protein n=1 Tax=Flavobacterium wongokense TaxID=2910674 RepID=UPI001F4849F3|nr:DinB family protein [Flavobacterium sp. WG47]MCF6132172.1 DinB family protein [Flavobacterium sp. WG47]
MTEQQRISSLFEKLYHGDPWIDINIVSTLSSLTAGEASKRVLPNCNTIWEITNHLISWRQNVLQRVHGNTLKTPSHNYFVEVKDTTEEAWTEVLKKLEETQSHWLHFLKNVKIEDFEKQYPVNNMTYYEHIQGIIQHDAYHLGQIVLLSKLL